MPLRREGKAATRTKVLGEAAKTILEQGVSGVGVASVMARAGLTHGGFYAHFESKAALVADTVNAMSKQFVSRYQLVVGDLPAEQALRAYVEHYLSPDHRDSVLGACPLPLLVVEAPRLEEAPQASIQQGVDALVAAIANHVRELEMLEADLAAASVVAELIGSLALARTLVDHAVSDQFLATARSGVLRKLGLSQGE